MEILENQCFEVKNLISVRKNSDQTELQNIIIKLLEYIKTQGAEKSAPTISATYAIDADTKLMDVEVFVPINKEIPSTQEYIFKPKLYLDNCVKITHKGNPQLLQNTCNLLNEYITRNKLVPISSGFNVTKTEITRIEDSDKFEVEVYVSISRNIT